MGGRSPLMPTVDHIFAQLLAAPDWWRMYQNRLNDACKVRTQTPEWIEQRRAVIFQAGKRIEEMLRDGTLVTSKTEKGTGLAWAQGVRQQARYSSSSDSESSEEEDEDDQELREMLQELESGYEQTAIPRGRPVVDVSHSQSDSPHASTSKSVMEEDAPVDHLEQARNELKALCESFDQRSLALLEAREAGDQARLDRHRAQRRTKKARLDVQALEREIEELDNVAREKGVQDDKKRIEDTRNELTHVAKALSTIIPAL